MVYILDHRATRPQEESGEKHRLRVQDRAKRRGEIGRRKKQTQEQTTIRSVLPRLEVRD